MPNVISVVIVNILLCPHNKLKVLSHGDKWNLIWTHLIALSLLGFLPHLNYNCIRAFGLPVAILQ